MTDVTQPPNHDAINLMLAKKIKELPEDRQVVLLKQLLKGDIVGLLFKLIGEMSEQQQALLLEQLGQSSERMVSLEETEIALRDYNRKSCMLNIAFTVEGQNFESFMLDISPAGAFVETKETFFAGQQITTPWGWYMSHSDSYRISPSSLRLPAKFCGKGCWAWA